MSAMTIAQLAKAVGVNVETVRYYQRRGLLRDPKPSQTPGSGIRRYDESDLQTLKFIAAGKNAGFTLAEIGRLKELDALDDRSEARRLAQERVALLDAEIARLQEARDHLQLLAHECGTGGAGPCPIIATLARS